MFKIKQCYDSHLHLMATGQVMNGLQLFELKTPNQLAEIPIKKNYFRGPWLVGFGWDEYKWQNAIKPHKSILDKIYFDFPVSLTRADGHACWLNSRALVMIGKSEHPTGVFVDDEKIKIDIQIPDYSLSQKKEFITSAITYLNKQGITHARDMSGTLEQWNLLRDLDRNNELKVYIEQNFTCENLNELDQVLQIATLAKAECTPHLRVAGVKIYYDGALGSDGAWLSNSNTSAPLWSSQDLAVLFKKTWRQGFSVAVHAIGDAAADSIVNSVLRLKEKNITGPLNLEHAQVLRNETILKMKGLNITCHMQPCHWLSDRKWLKSKLDGLYQNVFPWASLQKENIKIFWGSDSPIEPVSVFNTIRALRESAAEGIPLLKGDPLLNHSYPDPNWGGDCWSEFSGDAVRAVYFDGQQLI